MGGSVLSIAGAATFVTGLLLSGRYGWLLARRPFFVGDVQFNPFGTSPAICFLGLDSLRSLCSPSRSVEWNTLGDHRSFRCTY
jgi:hypothetical protein